MSVPFAERTRRLGTETAFAVGAEAARLASEGSGYIPSTSGSEYSDTRHIVEAANRAIRKGRRELPDPRHKATEGS